MQAIVTKFIPCTNARPNRIKAECDAGSVTLSPPDNLNPQDGHTWAAVQLIRKLGWQDRKFILGGMPQNSPYSNVYVIADSLRVWETVDPTDPKWNDENVREPVYEAGEGGE